MSRVAVVYSIRISAGCVSEETLLYTEECYRSPPPPDHTHRSLITSRIFIQALHCCARVASPPLSLALSCFQRLPPDVVDEFARVDRVHCDQSRRVFTFKYRLHEHQPTAVLNSLLSRVSFGSFGYFCSDFCLILVTHREARGRLWS